ncbi:MAG: hypothetical protein GXP32_10430, partial [Kiritimatiellaeota bacterium]|nr:hypothetical protein [Kiritimatiellota bacterium]
MRITFIVLLVVFQGVFARFAEAKDDVVQCGNLIYAGNNTSRCFSDEFLSAVQRRTSIATAR